MSWTKHLTNFNWISFFVRVNIIFNFFRKRNRWWTWIWRFCWRCWRAPWRSTGTWWLFLIWFKVFKLLCFFDFSGFDHFFVNGFRWISQLVADGLLWSFSCFNLKSCKILTRNFIRWQVHLDYMWYKFGRTRSQMLPFFDQTLSLNTQSWKPL